MLDQIGTILEHIDELEAKAYQKSDLGMTYAAGTFTFKVWSPHADAVYLNIYKTGDIEDHSLIEKIDMTYNDEHVWEVSVTENLEDLYYTYSFDHQGKMTEAPDLYSKAVGLNGDRTAIIHLKDTNPEHWEKDAHQMQEHITDAIIWEVHVEDFTADERSGISPKNRGKYLGFTEEGTTLDNAGAFPTGLDYLDKLGVNYVHLLPVYDFVNDELDEDYYNWGYDPKNYFAPEGKYSSDPSDPKARIKELKQLIQRLHQKNIGVVMDVVFNHTFHTEDSWFQRTVPNYYYRFNAYGHFSNGSGVGNETASERKMMRKYIIDAILYWTEEYHFDGFRFDLMGVHDTETMNAIRDALDQNGYEHVILYGEPWAGGELALPEPYKPADRNHVHDYSKRIALFNAEFRDAIKGHVFLDYDAAFLQGANDDYMSSFKNEDLIAAIIANTESEAGEYYLPHYKTWARVPTEVVNYSSAHDNFTLYDKLVLSTDRAVSYDRQEDLITMNKINAGILLTAQGGIFIHAGEEFARTKYGDPNTYNAPIEVNQLDWARAEENNDLIDYYRGMIDIRKAYAPFRDYTTQTAKLMHFYRNPENVLVYTIPNNIDEHGKWRNVTVAVNTSPYVQTVNIPTGEHDEPHKWTIIANIHEIDVDGIATYEEKTLTLQPNEIYILALENQD